jgi:hypothetical protein
MPASSPSAVRPGARVERHLQRLLVAVAGDGGDGDRVDVGTLRGQRLPAQDRQGVRVDLLIPRVAVRVARLAVKLPPALPGRTGPAPRRRPSPEVSFNRDVGDLRSTRSPRGHRAVAAGGPRGGWDRRTFGPMLVGHHSQRAWTGRSCQEPTWSVPAVGLTLRGHAPPRCGRGSGRTDRRAGQSGQDARVVLKGVPERRRWDCDAECGREAGTIHRSRPC